MTNPEVGAVLVTGDDEDNRDRQVMVSYIRQPQRLSLEDGSHPVGENQHHPHPDPVPNTC